MMPVSSHRPAYPCSVPIIVTVGASELIQKPKAAGALIPYMETHYNIGYAIVSLIFITNAIGFIATAFFTDLTREKLGRAKSCMLSEVLMIAGYLMIICTPPFPVVVVA